MIRHLSVNRWLVFWFEEVHRCDGKYSHFRTRKENRSVTRGFKYASQPVGSHFKSQQTSGSRQIFKILDVLLALFILHTTD